MADHERWSGALPFYAAGAVDAEERERIDGHLATCAGCRAALAEIRALAELGAVASVARVTEHVASGLLVEYASSPEALDPDVRAWIERRLAACATCREAYANLRAVDATLAESPPRDPANEAGDEGGVEALPFGRSRRGLWAGLSASLLRPAPALAYLLIAAVGLPLIWVLRSPGDPLAAVRVVPIAAERAVREGAAVEPPLELIAGDAGETLLLELETDLVAADLEGATFEVALRRRERDVWSDARAGHDFVLRDGRGVLTVALRPGRLEAGVEYRLEIRADRPGDPLDGQALFARTLRLRLE